MKIENARVGMLVKAKKDVGDGCDLGFDFFPKGAFLKIENIDTETSELFFEEHAIGWSKTKHFRIVNKQFFKGLKDE